MPASATTDSITACSMRALAPMVKLVDTADLKSAANERRRTGSIPVRTK